MLKVGKKKWKNPEIALKLSESPYFLNIFGNFSFLNPTLGLWKYFLNQTTCVLKNELQQQSFLNWDSTVFKVLPTIQVII